MLIDLNRLSQNLSSFNIDNSYFQYYMAKRALPQRTNRGQLPPHLRQETTVQRTIKKKPEDQEEKMRKAMEVNCKMNQLINLRKYPFGRAIHYFMSLDQLPRACQSVSYAINDRILQHTYSKDTLLIKQSKVGDLVNRTLIGLPINPTGEIIARKQNKCKNVCYAYLFDIEDKKHNNDRLIYTIKTILKRLHKLGIKELQKYDCIKKDSDLVQILNEEQSLEDKICTLQRKLSALTSRKQANYINWQFDDHVLFYHALNQRLHNKVVELKNQLSEQNLCQLVNGHVNNIDLQNWIDMKSRYYFSKDLIFSKKTLQLIKKIKNGCKVQINYPIVVLYFDRNLTSFTDFLISRRAFSMGQVHYYQVKAMVKKIFKRDLRMKSQKISSYQQYYKQFRKRYAQICRFKKTKVDKQPKIEAQPSPLLDDFVNTSPTSARPNILELEQAVLVTRKQYAFMMIYFWLSQALSNIHQYLLQFNDLLEIIGSDFYPKVCNPLVEAIGTPLTGIIFYLFQALTDLLNKAEPLPSIKNQLFCEYSQTLGISVIWRGQTIGITEQCKGDKYGKPCKKNKQE